MKFSIKDFFVKCDQIRGKLRIWSHLLKKSLMENFIFCAVDVTLFNAVERDILRCSVTSLTFQVAKFSLSVLVKLSPLFF